MPNTSDSSGNTQPEHDIVEIKIVKEWLADEIVELYKAGGWWKESYKPSGIPGVIHGSYAFVIAIEIKTGRAIGMGRAISDGVSDAYLQDVVVLKDWRGKGIGIKIVKALFNYCLDNDLLWIGLIAEPGTKSFYSPLGFKTLPGEPMVFQPEE